MATTATATMAGARTTTKSITTKANTLSTTTVVAVSDEAAKAARPHTNQEGGEATTPSNTGVINSNTGVVWKASSSMRVGQHRCGR